MTIFLSFFLSVGTSHIRFGRSFLGDKKNAVVLTTHITKVGNYVHFCFFREEGNLSNSSRDYSNLKVGG